MSFHALIPAFLLVIFLSLATPVHATTYARDGSVVGTLTSYTIMKGDTLPLIARRFDIGIVELRAANPDLDPKKLKEGEQLVITSSHVLPAIREGIVINLPELRLFYFPDDATVMTFPVGLGREGWETPPGDTKVIRKRKNPIWTPPESIREENPNLPEFIPPGPQNPLGHYALDLGLTGYAIHGTNQPYSIGKHSTHGCIRLYPEDIEALFNAVATGTPVSIVDESFKLGWQGDRIFLEVSPIQQQTNAYVTSVAPSSDKFLEGIRDAVNMAAEPGTKIDWYAVDRIVAAHNGLPTPIGWKDGAIAIDGAPIQN